MSLIFTFHGVESSLTFKYLIQMKNGICLNSNFSKSIISHIDCTTPIWQAQTRFENNCLLNSYGKDFSLNRGPHRVTHQMCIFRKKSLKIVCYRCSSVHHGLLQAHFFKFGAILPIYIHNSLSFSVKYKKQNQAILLHEIH